MKLPDDKKLELYNAIVDYGLDGIEKSLSPIVEIAMSFIKPQIDRNNERHRQRIEQQRINGSKGGRPKKNPTVSEKPNGLDKNPNNPRVSEKPNGFFQNPKKPYNNINIKDKENNCKQLSKDANASSSSSEDVALEDCLIWKDEKINISKLVSFWNSKVQGSVIPTIRNILGERRSKLNARLKQYGKKAIFEAIEKVGASDFLKGNISDKGWHATFDWFVCPTNFAKVLEGNYDNQQQRGILYGNGYKGNYSSVQQGAAERQKGYAKVVNELIDEAERERANRGSEESE